jgi:methylated-DNA-[protein]-cysteine S-methyltransferase
MGECMTDFFIETFATPTGTMLLVTDDEAQVRALDWEDFSSRMHQLLRLHYGSPRLEPKGGASPARRAVEAYYEGDLTVIGTLPVKTGGTAFQRSVWAALRMIPTGKTTTYGSIAVGLGRPKAMRAVGMANGANPISVVVPCHRVIGADATLTGYGGGLQRKRWLLRHEGVVTPA